MKSLLTFGLVTTMLTLSLGAAETPPRTLADTDADVQNLSQKVEEMSSQIQEINDRIRDIEDRLGTSYKAPSPLNTVERRLDDLEDDVRSLKR